MTTQGTFNKSLPNSMDSIEAAIVHARRCGQRYTRVSNETPMQTLVTLSRQYLVAYRSDLCIELEW